MVRVVPAGNETQTRRNLFLSRDGQLSRNAAASDIHNDGIIQPKNSFRFRDERWDPMTRNDSVFMIPETRFRVSGGTRIFAGQTVAVVCNAAARDERTMANGVLTLLLRPCSYFGDLLRRVLRQRVIFHFRYAAVRERECECVTCVSLCDAKCAPGRCYASFHACTRSTSSAPILGEILLHSADTSRCDGRTGRAAKLHALNVSCCVILLSYFVLSVRENCNRNHETRKMLDIIYI